MNPPFGILHRRHKTAQRVFAGARVFLESEFDEQCPDDAKLIFPYNVYKVMSYGKHFNFLP